MSINTTEHKKRIQEFLKWFEHCTGYEKGEGQIFFDRLLQAFGNAGVLQVGASCEKPVKRRKSSSTAFVDFIWKPKVIIELKKRGAALHKHYDQAFEYWLTCVPNRPQYMILCNFDEFWIYDLNVQLNDPVHILRTENLLEDWPALGFLFFKSEKPIFNNNNVEVTEEVAKIVGSLYLSLTERKVDPDRAQRFVLQLVVALFAEDVDLIPKHTLYKILEKAVKEPVTQKELLDLFTAMAVDKAKDKPTKYKSIAYFNGGIFREVEPVELNFKELDYLYEASKFNWSKVRPSIFGSIFEGSMDPKKRHGHGIHFTSELDIQKIVGPTIVRPFREKIDKAKSKKDLGKVLKEVTEFRVLDPACGSGNFLYIAFRELRRLEAEILEARGEDPRQVRMSHVSPKNFFGIDTNHFAVELAKVALSIGRKMSADELGLVDTVLPFEDLDENFNDKDALLEAEWPDTEVIIGNPPFQSRRTMQDELGVEYINSIRTRFEDIPGNADYCVYWFRKAHDQLKESGRAGLVGTNTIRQNYSREGGLDYIVSHNGTITEAVSTQVWSGDAVVHVSIVNWIKGRETKKKKLYYQRGDSVESPWEVFELDHIPSTLSVQTDVSSAKTLKCNVDPKTCFQGQTHGHEGFLLKKSEAEKFIKNDSNFSKVIFPYLTGRELVGSKNEYIKRYVIDFGDKSITQAMKYKTIFNLVKEKVFSERKEKADKEEKRNKKVLRENSKAKVNKHHQNFFKRWWQLSWARVELIEKIGSMQRYIACSATTKRQIFEFVSSEIHPNAKLQVFTFEDDYSFGIVSSSYHWLWFKEKCTTLKGDFSYNEKSIWDTFPWPQSPNLKDVEVVVSASKGLRELRRKIMKENDWSLRDLYRSVDIAGENELRNAHSILDKAVLRAYGFKNLDNMLEDLLTLNLEISRKETNGDVVTGPGIPPCVKSPKSLISEDCINIEVD